MEWGLKWRFCKNNIPLGPANANGVTNVTTRMKLRRCIVHTNTRSAGSGGGAVGRAERHPRHKKELLGNE